MPLLLDIPGVFLAGSTIAIVSRKRIQVDAPMGESRYVGSALAFGVVYGLSVAFLCFWREDWMWSYLIRPPLPTMMWYLVFLAVLATTAWGGAISTQRAIRNNQPRLAWGLVLGSFLVLVAAWAITFDRYTHLGTYEEYHTGMAYTFDEMPNTRFVIFIGVAINVTALAIIGLVNWRTDRRALKRDRAA